MQIKIILIFFLILCFKSTLIFGQRINIKIFTESNVKSFIFSPVIGKYQIMSDSSIVITLTKNEIINLILVNDSIEIKTIDKKIGIYKNIYIKGIANANYAKVKCVLPLINQRLYDDDIQVSIQNNSFYLINNVDIENYVSGVVECEGGQKADIEYYKTQAIICRTYALENLNRHINEGYNLCDNVHCQVFKGKSLTNFDIPDATTATAGLVIVDSTLSLITAAFYSNCGGQTVSSEDVWLKPKSYLKSISDTFCIHQRSAIWEKKIPIVKWKQYLVSNGFAIIDTVPSIYSFYQLKRKTYYKINNDSIPLRKIRLDWNLRSTYFNITPVGSNLLFKGKGYGHGVGLCQEGAMNMSKKGYSYKEIIKYYYKNTNIVSMRALNFFKEP
jgi:stage II sporulation protein D